MFDELKDSIENIKNKIDEFLGGGKKQILKDHIADVSAMLGTRQWTDQFVCFVEMIEPETKMPLNINAIKGFNFKGKSFSIETTSTGTAHTSTYDETETEDVTITFLESNLDEVRNYLLYKSDKRAVRPTDGTFLLPFEHYFKITLCAMNGDYEVRDISQGRLDECIMEGGIDREFEVEGDMEIHETRFVPILSS